MNRVTLVFDKTLSNLAGYEFGVKIYKEQVEGKIDFEKKFEIVFPKEIRMVAASFVQGFFSDIVRKIGLKATEENLVIPNERLQMSVLKKLQ